MHKLDTEVSSLDLRVLRFLKILLTTSSVTRTASHLGISQPAASRILARIRDLVGDPILIRTQSGYQLTDYALGLRHTVESAIQAVEDVFASSTFDPETSHYRFRIASTDYGVAAVLGPIMEQFAKTAPGLRIDVSSLVPRSFEGLQSGDLDLMLYINVTEGGDLLAQKLYEETYEVLYRQGHPLQEIAKSKSDLSPKDLSPFRQIEFNFPGTTELKPDTIMRSDEGQLAPVFHQPFFTTLPFLIGENDAVAAVPKRLGVQIQRVTNLCSSPFRRGESFPYYLVRHERTRHNLAINWFVEQAMASVKRR
ncbi:LysR family transcriptional regulator [uncultured Roseovarius sp.]|uniref:LysR family transcriptional regulator n=1 Tax=uncultured Roseovarius sp. TaxID=293344 RepID=UPI002611CCD6|nr:LysR family transcriptional regulator [uncultured Roseovarius sp.]